MRDLFVQQCRSCLPLCERANICAYFVSFIMDFVPFLPYYSQTLMIMKFLQSFTDYYSLWQEKCGEFRTDLPLLAQDLLCCPSTSVPSERLFSISGLLSDNRSSQIKPHNLGGKLIIIPSEFLVAVFDQLFSSFLKHLQATKLY